MSDTISTPAAVSADTTFRDYSLEQSQTYAKHRLSYHDSVYQTVMNYHVSNGGQLGTILDIGCGPGTALRDLAPHFTHAIGLDPSEGMISTAKSLGSASANSKPIFFALSTAEELGSNLTSPIPDDSVDLIIAASCAHWFDTSRFWSRAAQILKAGGAVAIWGGGGLRVDLTTPNHVAVQAAIDNLYEHVADYMEPGNWVVRGLYNTLPLPWSLKTHVSEFNKSSFLRKEWNTGHQSGPSDHFYSNQSAVNIDTLEQMMGTDSPVTRWREAHPNAVGTERDVVRIMRREIERALEDFGVGAEEKVLKGGVQGALLMVRKKN